MPKEGSAQCWMTDHQLFQIRDATFISDAATWAYASKIRGRLSSTAALKEDMVRVGEERGKGDHAQAAQSPCAWQAEDPPRPLGIPPDLPACPVAEIAEKQPPRLRSKVQLLRINKCDHRRFGGK
jgi:hypothetical protein